MNLLVLGGTRFLGRHVVEDALSRGHCVTIFSRGRTTVPWSDRVVALRGERDPAIAPGLRALGDAAEGTVVTDRSFDAVVDCSGYVPRVVDASARLLADCARRYLFVSSVSVYANLSRPGIDEAAAVATLADPATEDVLPHYGALKAACEVAVSRVYESNATIVRPGLIVGPYDATERFGYWVARFVHPRLLGERGARAVVPAPPERPLQFVDVRDLAAFIVGLVERDIGGTFNAASPQGRMTMGTLVEALTAVSGRNAPEAVWIDDAKLVAAGVEPWMGLPLWLPPGEPDSAGMMAVSCARAEAAGLATRDLVGTVRDTAAWLAQRSNSRDSIGDGTGAWRQVLSAAAERSLTGESG